MWWIGLGGVGSDGLRFADFVDNQARWQEPSHRIEGLRWLGRSTHLDLNVPSIIRPENITIWGADNHPSG